MSLVQLVFTVIKIAVILGILLGVGGALTWNDRRMSSMIQDRIGPNRARFVLPAPVAKGMFGLPALLVAGLVLLWGFSPAKPADMTGKILVQSELAVLVGWITLAMLTTWTVRRGEQAVSNPLEKFLLTNTPDPRTWIYGGFIAHILVLAFRFALPATLKAPLAVVSTSALAFTIMLAGVAAVTKVPADGYKLRLIGLLHTMADGLKMIFKEDFVPKDGDKIIHGLAPMIALFPSLVVFAVIPFGDVLCFATDPAKGGILWTKVLPSVARSGVCQQGGVPMQIANVDIGILFIFAISSTGVLGAALGGWASNNKYSLLGGLRAAGQMVSYEVTLGLTLVGLFMIYGTLHLDDMVRWQGNHAWGIFLQPLAFVLFVTTAIAENKRIPFDLPEGESEIVGYFTEYSGMKFGMFFFAEYIEIVTSSALVVTLFLGGWQMPFLHRDGITVALGDSVLYQAAMSHGAVITLQVLSFFGKVLAFAWLLVVIRWTLPRFRYDQLMKLAWRNILPLSVANVLVTGAAILALDALGADETLQSIGDITQGLLLLALIVGVIAAARWLLAPVQRKPLIISTSTELAAKQGGTRSTPMEA